MATTIENRWEVLAILGNGIPPFAIMFDDLDRVMNRPGLEFDEAGWSDLRAWFQPAEDNPAQVRQAAERRAFARVWSLDRHGELVEWLVEAGVTDDDVLEAPAGA